MRDPRGRGGRGKEKKRVSEREREREKIEKERHPPSTGSVPKHPQQPAVELS